MIPGFHFPAIDIFYSLLWLNKTLVCIYATFSYLTNTCTGFITWPCDAINIGVLATLEWADLTLLDVYPQVVYSSHMQVVFSIFWGISTWISAVTGLIYILINIIRVLNPLQILTILFACFLLVENHSDWTDI